MTITSPCLLWRFWAVIKAHVQCFDDCQDYVCGRRCLCSLDGRRNINSIMWQHCVTYMTFCPILYQCIQSGLQVICEWGFVDFMNDDLSECTAAPHMGCTCACTRDDHHVNCLAKIMSCANCIRSGAEQVHLQSLGLANARRLAGVTDTYCRHV